MNLKQNETLTFNQNKKVVFKKFIGQGGTGKTILVRDKITNYEFVVKKYSPNNEKMRDEYFNRFIDEIIIMYPLFHDNIVRIYNYYLYPDKKTGYIFMEYIEGSSISNYLHGQDEKVFENIFFQLIEAFKYLENNKILHRDIREKNILITDDGLLKIIDFGFGKRINIKSKQEASIILNWPVSEMPKEIYEKIYNHKTEIYFVGKLFNKIISKEIIDKFKYQYIINKMIKPNPKNRIDSFSEIYKTISKNIIENYNFSNKEKEIYLSFANKLDSMIVKMKDEIDLVLEPKKIKNSLDKLINSCILEKFLQDNRKLINCFVNNDYIYSTKEKIRVEILKEFYDLFSKLSTPEKKIIIKNIESRLNNIEITYDDFEVPF